MSHFPRVVVPREQAEKKLFFWNIVEEGEEGRRIRLLQRKWNNILCMYPLASRVYPYPQDAQVAPLLARFKDDIGWKGNAGDDVRGRIGDAFWWYHWQGDEPYITVEVRAVVRNKAVVMFRRYMGQEPDMPFPKCILFYVDLIKELDGYASAVANIPKPQDGPSVTYDLLDEEDDRKVKVTYQRLEAGHVMSEYSQVFDMKDPSSLAELNRHMAQVLLFCTKIQPC